MMQLTKDTVRIGAFDPRDADQVHALQERAFELGDDELYCWCNARLVDLESGIVPPRFQITGDAGRTAEVVQLPSGKRGEAGPMSARAIKAHTLVRAPGGRGMADEWIDRLVAEYAETVGTTSATDARVIVMQVLAHRLGRLEPEATAALLAALGDAIKGKDQASADAVADRAEELTTRLALRAGPNRFVRVRARGDHHGRRDE